MAKLRTREYFPHDYNARNDLKLQCLQEKQGMAGIGLYWCIIEIMYEQDGYIMPEQCQGLAYALKLPDVLPLEDLLNNYKLFIKNSHGYSSKTLLTRLKSRQRKCNLAKQAIEKRWKNKALVKDTDVLRTYYGRNTSIEEDSIVKNSIVEDNKEKDKDLSQQLVPPGTTPAPPEPKKEPRKAFVIPTLEEVQDYISSHKLNVNALKLHAYYSSNGWKVGKNPMKSWKAAIVNWSQKEN